MPVAHMIGAVLFGLAVRLVTGLLQLSKIVLITDNASVSRLPAFWL